jgi:hypothetical protein
MSNKPRVSTRICRFLPLKSMALRVSTGRHGPHRAPAATAAEAALVREPSICCSAGPRYGISTGPGCARDSAIRSSTSAGSFWSRPHGSRPGARVRGSLLDQGGHLGQRAEGGYGEAGGFGCLMSVSFASREVGGRALIRAARPAERRRSRHRALSGSYPTRPDRCSACDAVAAPARRYCGRRCRR